MAPVVLGRIERSTIGIRRESMGYNSEIGAHEIGAMSGPEATYTSSGM